MPKHRKFRPRRPQLNWEFVFDVILQKGFCDLATLLNLYRVSRTISALFKQFYMCYRDSPLFFVDNSWFIIYRCCHDKTITTSRRKEFDLADSLIAHDYQKLAQELIQTFNLPVWQLHRGVARNGKLTVFKLYEEKIECGPYFRSAFYGGIQSSVIAPIFSTELPDYFGLWRIVRYSATRVCNFVKSAIQTHSSIGLKWCLDNMKDLPPKDWSSIDGVMLYAECKSDISNNEEDAILQAICQIRVNGQCEYDEIVPGARIA